MGNWRWCRMFVADSPSTLIFSYKGIEKEISTDLFIYVDKIQNIIHVDDILRNNFIQTI